MSEKNCDNCANCVTLKDGHKICDIVSLYTSLEIRHKNCPDWKSKVEPPKEEA